MNPYEVLGVSPDADEETIKKAYRDLIKKYHPDRYINNPLADLAAEKTKEINKAYDMIMNKGGGQRQNGTQSSGGGEYYRSAGGNSGFAAVRSLISQNRIMEAMSALSGLPKTAEWYYLNGVICMRRGWYDQAVTSLKQACAMEPENVEYRAALENVINRNTTYRTGPVTDTGCYVCPCDCCTTLACLNCCC